MIFTCDNCGFIFSRSEETEQCPDCGKYEVRPASEEEQQEFAQRMAELSRSEHSEQPRIPDMEDTELSMFSSFSFRLPATALQIDSGMIVDIAVEYGENPANRSELVGNAWVRQEGGAFRRLPHVRPSARETGRSTEGTGEPHICLVERGRCLQDKAV